MKRQYAAEISDLLVFYDIYELCTVEAGRIEVNDTKRKNDCTKLAVTCKQMLINLSYHAPELQHTLKIVGMGINGLDLNMYQLTNPRGMASVLEKTDELYFPVHMFEFRTKMITLLEKLWLIRMETEETFRVVCSSGGGSASSTLTPCFKKSI